MTLEAGNFLFSPWVFLTSNQSGKLPQKCLVFLELRLRWCHSVALQRWGSIWVPFKAAPSQETWRVTGPQVFKGSGARHTCQLRDLFRDQYSSPGAAQPTVRKGDRSKDCSTRGVFPGRKWATEKIREQLTLNCTINLQPFSHHPPPSSVV